ncbi:hypothetical protein [Elizabethkingia miricola]|uniref:hypothetical protein n=1 Tax=Elizabethkingia miricola TaxID=172045 RepID=UPI000C155730|nr:hypothetical protein [Elizabethkingia miricola]NHQ72502.1 hypothetical protein [Elizabethkingia miricola]PSL89273.1 hypothetical protein C7V10_05835 [Elizabethkingia miricola]QHQ85411.1 hypothetical protein FE632_00750 [Elizabethkingia miricola]UIO96621.1 hypothetical protein LYZ41_00745 [Elizabethkingia miricola]WER13408.1 hypothetical protein P0M31_00755 [Elizabethkingia miricola]
MNNKVNPSFDFIKTLNEDKTYKLLFPEREVGLAIVLIFEKIENKTFGDAKFTEKDLHDAFEQIYITKERYPKEVYSEQIMNLQEYFLDYDQQTQKYYFKDYAYKFCKHAKETLQGAFNPTRIQKICIHLTNTLRNSDDLRFWLKEEFKKYEPDLREQIDFLDRQISLSIEDLKKEISFINQSFIDVLVATEERLTKSQSHVNELRSAYSETKTMRALLEEKDNSDNEINELISDVHSFIKYINDRLSSIDRKLDRIQPKIRQLFSTLNKPAFNSKIEKFILLLLKKSDLDNKKNIVFPQNIPCPVIHIPTPNFTIINRDRELFPPKPKERKQYKQNEKIIRENKEKILAKINEIDTIRKWENFILSEIALRGLLNLSEVFFRILKEENSSQIAVTVLFNLIKYTYSNPEKLQLIIEKSLETNDEFKNVSLWKMSITKLQ